MSGAYKDPDFDLLAHEKKISELYQNRNEQPVEVPSVQLDSRIMAMAQQQLSNNARLLTKSQTLNHQKSEYKNINGSRQNAWRWPLSLVASVGLLGVLLLTQNDFFKHPNNIVATDTGILSEPVMQAPVIGATETLSEQREFEQSFESITIVASSQKYQGQADKEFSSVARKRMSVSQTPQIPTESMSNKPLSEYSLANPSSMSLSELSELAELLKVELAIENMSELATSASSLKLQQTLFEQLVEYQKHTVEFTITDKYLSVLTERQIQQLKLKATKAVSEN